MKVLTGNPRYESRSQYPTSIAPLATIETACWRSGHETGRCCRDDLIAKYVPKPTITKPRSVGNASSPGIPLARRGRNRNPSINETIPNRTKITPAIRSPVADLRIPLFCLPCRFVRIEYMKTQVVCQAKKPLSRSSSTLRPGFFRSLTSNFVFRMYSEAPLSKIRFGLRKDGN